MSVSPALGLYLLAAEIAGPLARVLLRRRSRRGKEDAARLPERFGVASTPRTDGPLIWLHGASVGEGTAALTLIREMTAARGDLRFLLTTGTSSSSATLRSRLPENVIHQFAPVDVAPAARRFLAHWRPDLAVRIDSELWPATIVATARAGAPLAMANARISERSARRWMLARGMARALFERFSLILAQDAASAARFVALGASEDRVRVGGSLKAASAPPGADPAEIASLRATLAGRPVWAALSTHAGEDEIVIEAHREAARRLPGLLCLIAPRHPERGGEIAALAGGRGLTVARRGGGEAPDTVDVYVADTLGEMGLWLRLAPLAFIGGSLTRNGGHNPYEPAALGVLIAHGPHVESFADAYAALGAASRPVGDAAGLADTIVEAVTPSGALSDKAGRDAEAAREALGRNVDAARLAARALIALVGR